LSEKPEDKIPMKPHTDDIFLLRKLKAGDESIFKYIFETYFTPLCRFIFLYIKDKDIVEDIVLDMYAHLWEKREQLDIRISIKAYLFQSVKNRAFNYIRDNERMFTTPDMLLFDQSEENYTVELNELEVLIQEAIQALPEKCREVFRRSRVDYQSNKEIAEAMNISTKTVESQITKALKHIREYLGSSYHYLW